MQGSVESKSWPRLLLCVSAIDSRRIRVNVEGGLGPDFARLEFPFQGGQTDKFPISAVEPPGKPREYNHQLCVVSATLADFIVVIALDEMHSSAVLSWLVFFL